MSLKVHVNRLALLAASALTPFPSAAQVLEDLELVEITTVGVDLATGVPIALLRDRSWERLVPIWIGAEEAQAMARAIQGAPMPRPMTHDLLGNVIIEMGGTVEEVAVYGMDASGETFLGRIRIRVGSERLHIDSRPSDALALALRTGAAVRVAPFLIREAPELDFLVLDTDSEVLRILGMTLGRSNAERRREFSLPNRAGLVVLHVSAELAEMGLRRGDLVVDVNGDVPRGPMAFLDALGHARSNEAVRIVYVRDGTDALLLVPPGRLGRPQARRRQG